MFIPADTVVDSSRKLKYFTFTPADMTKINIPACTAPQMGLMILQTRLIEPCWYNYITDSLQ